MDRTLFPALGDRIWLNWATTPPAPAPVLAAIRAAQDAWADGSFSWRKWEADAEATRPLFANLIGAPADTVALMPSVAEAAATVARSIPRGRVVVGSREFRSNLFPWLQLARHGFEVIEVPSREGVVATAALCDAVTPGTVLVAVTEVQSSNGYRVDLTRIARRCKESGARLFVNLTQSLGVLRYDHDLAADYVAAHGYKWMLGPRGAAWLHVRSDRIDELEPLAPSWKTPPDPYADYYGGPLAQAPGARKLDLPLSWFPWVGARAALELVSSLDRVRVEAEALGLARGFRERASRAGFRLVPHDRESQVVGMVLPDPDAATERLRGRRIEVAVRGGFLRVGFHVFNDASDVEACLEALEPA